MTDTMNTGRVLARNLARDLERKETRWVAGGSDNPLMSRCIQPYCETWIDHWTLICDPPVSTP